MEAKRSCADDRRARKRHRRPFDHFLECACSLCVFGCSQRAHDCGKRTDSRACAPPRIAVAIGSLLEGCARRIASPEGQDSTAKGRTSNVATGSSDGSREAGSSFEQPRRRRDTRYDGSHASAAMCHLAETRCFQLVCGRIGPVDRHEETDRSIASTATICKYSWKFLSGLRHVVHLLDSHSRKR